MLNKIYDALDSASRLTLKRIAVTMFVLTFLSLFAAAGHRLNFFLALTGLAVLVSAVLAMRARQKLNAPELNYWDETIFFMFVSVVALPLTE